MDDLLHCTGCTHGSLQGHTYNSLVHQVRYPPSCIFCYVGKPHSHTCQHLSSSRSVQILKDQEGQFPPNHR